MHTYKLSVGLRCDLWPHHSRTFSLSCWTISLNPPKPISDCPPGFQDQDLLQRIIPTAWSCHHHHSSQWPWGPPMCPLGENSLVGFLHNFSTYICVQSITNVPASSSDSDWSAHVCLTCKCLHFLCFHGVIAGGIWRSRDAVQRHTPASRTPDIHSHILICNILG